MPAPNTAAPPSSFSIANLALDHAAVVQRTIDKDFRTRKSTLADLNTALGNLNPVVGPLTLANLGVAGITGSMVDAVIAANNDTIYDGIAQADVIGFYTAALTTAVNTTAPTYTYDAHGDIHFPGGTAAAQSRFTADSGTVNPILRGLITAVIGRIRRDANGNRQGYYYAVAAIPQSRGHFVKIELTYLFDSDTVDFHGHPDNTINAAKLSRSKAGAEIA